MNKIPSRRLLLACAVLLSVCAAITSCGKKSNAPQPAPVAELKITSVVPANGVAGSVVTIAGSGFNVDASQNVVTFNGKPAAVNSASATSITVMVPFAAGNGKIVVSTGNKTVTSVGDFNFIYTAGTVAGDGNPGLLDGIGRAAQFNGPFGMATDAAGNIYITDSGNNCIRKITPNREVKTITGKLIGNKNGPLNEALFNYPHGLALDEAGNIYVADAGNNLIRKISADGVVSTVAGSGVAGSANGTGTAAEFNFPAAIALDRAGNLYVTDGGNKRIRKITPAGVVTNFTDAVFNFPEGIAIDAAGNLYVADTAAGLIRKVTVDGIVTRFAGSGTFGLADGLPDVAQFFDPEGLAIDAAGNLYIGDLANAAIRKITPAGVVSTIAGNGTRGNTDGAGADARFHGPSGITVDAAGTVYVGDIDNALIRRLQ